MTNDTTFIGTEDGLTADNLLKPAKGEIFLLNRTDTNFVASQADIDNNLLYDLGPLGATAVVTANLNGVDLVIPTLTTRTMASNNSTTTLAKVGDVITLTIVGSELLAKPVVTIAGHTIAANAVVVGGTAATWTATYTLVSGDTNGSIPFTVHAADVFGNAVAATTLSGGVGVTLDKTVPTIVSATRVSATSYTVTLSELLAAASITKATAGGFVVYQTGTPATTYAVSAINPGATNDLITITVADTSASTVAGVTITYVAGGNGTVADLAGNLLATNATGVTAAA